MDARCESAPSLDLEIAEISYLQCGDDAKWLKYFVISYTEEVISYPVSLSTLQVYSRSHEVYSTYTLEGILITMFRKVKARRLLSNHRKAKEVSWLLCLPDCFTPLRWPTSFQFFIV